MVPTVKALLDVETIRDGGSLAAFFLDDEGQKWILFLGVDLRFHQGSNDNEGWVERMGFKQPLLIDADPAKRPADTHYVSHSELSGPASPLAWEDAKALVGQLSELATTLNRWASEAFDHLVIAVDSRGGLRPGTPRFAPTRRFYPKT